VHDDLLSASCCVVDVEVVVDEGGGEVEVSESLEASPTSSRVSSKQPLRLSERRRRVGATLGASHISSRALDRPETHHTHFLLIKLQIQSSYVLYCSSNTLFNYKLQLYLVFTNWVSLYGISLDSPQQSAGL
jgi:hypothetical protein